MEVRTQRTVIRWAAAFCLPMACGCYQLQPMRPMLTRASQAPVMHETLPAPMIPAQGYLEKGYRESGTPAQPAWNGGQSPYAAQASFAVPTAAGGIPSGPMAAAAPIGPATMPAPLQQQPPYSSTPMPAAADVELRQSLEELYGKYNLALEQIVELRREVAANAESIKSTSEQLKTQEDDIKNVRTKLASWRTSLDGLEQRVRADRQAQLDTLDEVETLLMSILANDGRAR